MYSPFFPYVGGFMLLFGLVIVSIIVRKAIKGIGMANRFLQEGIQVEGKVVDSWQKVVKAYTLYAPIVKYTAMDGKTYTVKGEIFKRGLPEMGRLYPVYYKANDPAIGMVNPAGVKRANILMIVVGVIVLGGMGRMMFSFFQMQGF